MRMLAGTTRDRVYGVSDWSGLEFTVVDTGGLQDEREIDATSSVEIARYTPLWQEVQE